MIWIKRFRETVLDATKSTWIYRFWHSAMQNLFIINRFEHIESNESIDSIIYNNDKVLDAFVRVFCDENTISNETHIEQQTHAIYFHRKSKTYAEIWTKKLRIWRILNLTNIQFVQWARNKSDEHAICLTSSQWVMNMR